jgi:hypothetical protein
MAGFLFGVENTAALMCSDYPGERVSRLLVADEGFRVSIGFVLRGRFVVSCVGLAGDGAWWHG